MYNYPSFDLLVDLSMLVFFSYLLMHICLDKPSYYLLKIRYSGVFKAEKGEYKWKIQLQKSLLISSFICAVIA